MLIHIALLYLQMPTTGISLCIHEQLIHIDVSVLHISIVFNKFDIQCNFVIHTYISHDIKTSNSQQPNIYYQGRCKKHHHQSKEEKEKVFIIIKTLHTSIPVPTLKSRCINQNYYIIVSLTSSPSVTYTQFVISQEL